ncbi:MAG TPA: DUF3109 family protein [Flavisolibacter sp.]|nr:DUF3109 family protein [Flavisolibacter sp.]
MISIDNVLVSDDVIQAKFVCDLHKCKGGCCEDGDAGAPLEKEELLLLEEHFENIKPYLTPEGLAEIKRKGKYLYDREFGWVTPTINSKICAYGYRDKHGIIKCGIEQAWNDKKIEWKKPISCHMYPIRVTKNKEYINLNYEPRDVLCSPACALGKKLKLPVYQFLKDALVRMFGIAFYNALHQIAIEHFDEADKSKK